MHGHSEHCNGHKAEIASKNDRKSQMRTRRQYSPRRSGCQQRSVNSHSGTLYIGAMECILDTANQEVVLGWVESANEGRGMLNARRPAMPIKADIGWYNILPENHQLVCPNKERLDIPMGPVTKL